MEAYVTKHEYAGIRPVCKECGEQTNFVSGKNIYRDYCPNHSNLARAAWSKHNGYGATQNAGWKKGLTKETHSGIKSQSEKMTGENNPWFEKRLPEETIKLATIARVAKLTLSEQTYNEQISELKNFKVHTEYKDYYNNYKQLLDVSCVSCGEKQKKTLWMLKNGTVCRACTPYSNEERDAGDFIQSLGVNVERNTRAVIPPSELDIYSPEGNIAFEYNGLFWHNENHKKKEHHINKTIACNEKGIRLVHIYSDEWTYKQEIVKSMIRNKFGFITNKIPARSCSIREIENHEAESFFDNNHLSGHTNSKIYFGLFYKEELVSAISLRVPRHKSYNGKIEIGRFASKINTIIPGGFSKLLNACKQWCKDNNIKEIITYANLSHGTGSVYTKCGFQFVKNTELDYWYTDGERRYDRFKFRANNGLTESEVAAKAKVCKIYGCGSALYQLNI